MLVQGRYALVLLSVLVLFFNSPLKYGNAQDAVVFGQRQT